MRKVLIITFFFAFHLGLLSQNFVWYRGSNIAGQPGTYGTQGTNSVTNDPGARHGCGTWVDKSGNLWLFGGEGYSTNTTLCWLNDLWKYNPASNEWTWIRGSNGPNSSGVYGTQGVAASANEPGAREFMMTWVDTSGMFWLFGGDGYGSTSTFGRLGDLWRYDPSANQWTWMKGYNTVDQNGVYGSTGVPSASNVPGARMASAAWINDNKLWLFGGRGFPASGAEHMLNDLWRYDIATNQWTWINGSNLTLQSGVYGTLGTTTSSNSPGSRYFSSYWNDNQGNLYLFAGVGLPASNLLGHLSDFWKYNIAGNTWTWVHGPNATNQNGQYGMIGVPDATVRPGGRMAAASWSDPGGNFWLFGGFGYPAAGLHLSLNDVFRYEPVTNTWTWMKGSDIGDQSGDYGTQTVPSQSNIPGAREYNTWWTDHQGSFWLFGGLGYDDTTSSLSPADNMNDLWGFQPPCNPDSIISNANSFCGSGLATLIAFNQFPALVKWYATPTGSVALATGSNYVTPLLTSSLGSGTYSFYAESNSCSFRPRTTIVLTVQPLPPVSISIQTPVCSQYTFVASASGASSYTWNTGSFSASSTQNAVFPFTTLIVSGIDSNMCGNSDTAKVAVNPLPTVTINGPPGACSGELLTGTASGANSYNWNTGSFTFSTSTLAQMPATTLIVTGVDANGCEDGDTLLVQTLPAPNLVISSSHNTLCVGNTATLDVSGAASYTWALSGNNNSSIVIAPGINTSYTVSGTGNNGCHAKSVYTQTVADCTGLKEELTHNSCFLYPNPNTGHFKVSCGILENAVLILTDLTGQMLYEKEITTYPTELQVPLAPGLYMVLIQVSQQVVFSGKVTIF